jgi:hypothetical protein
MRWVEGAPFDDAPPRAVPATTEDAVKSKDEPKTNFVTNGVIAGVALKRVQIRDLLTVMLRPLNLSYEIEGNFIWISSPEKLGKEDFSPPEAAGGSAALVAALNEPGDFDVEESSVAAFLSLLRREYGVTSRIDSKLKRTNLPIVQRFRMNDVVLHQALSVFLRKVGLTYTLDGESVVVSVAD